MISASVAGNKAKGYEISAGPVFKFETKDDYVYVDKWFEQLGQSVEKWLEAPTTKRIFGRIAPLIDGPVVMSALDITTTTEEKKDKEPRRIAVNKYAVAAVIGFLKSDDLRSFVSDHMPINVLVSSKCESLHIRTTDGWFSVTRVSEYLGFNVDDFVKSEQVRNIVAMFGAVIAAEPVKGSNGKTTVWMHPVGLLPMMLWLDSPASLELMASFFMTSPDLLPNLDAMKPLMEKNMKLRAQAKAKAQAQKEAAALTQSE
jgi:hypothetical protein